MPSADERRLSDADASAVEHDTSLAPLHHLQAHLSELSVQHATVNARLLSTLDSLDVVQSSHAATLDSLQAERDALEDHNSLLLDELASAQQQLAQCRAALQEDLTIAPGLVNDIAEREASMQLAPLTADLSTRGYSELDSSSSDLAGQRPPKDRSKSRSMQARSIIVGLSHQLEYTKAQADDEAREAAAENAVLRSQLSSRDEELQTLFAWLDRVLGLSGYRAVQEMREAQTQRSASEPSEVEMTALQDEVAKLCDETTLQYERLHQFDIDAFSVPTSPVPLGKPEPFVEAVIDDVQRQIADATSTLADLRREECRLLRSQGHPLSTSLGGQPDTDNSAQRLAELEAQLARSESRRIRERAELEAFCERVMQHFDAKEKALLEAERQTQSERRYRVAAESMLEQAHGAMDRMLASVSS